MLKESSLEEHNANPAITGINDTNTNIPVRSPVQRRIAMVQKNLGILHSTHTNKWKSQHITVPAQYEVMRTNPGSTAPCHLQACHVSTVIKHQESI